jgi:hypothetical protein
MSTTEIKETTTIEIDLETWMKFRELVLDLRLNESDNMNAKRVILSKITRIVADTISGDAAALDLLRELVAIADKETNWNPGRDSEW